MLSCDIGQLVKDMEKSKQLLKKRVQDNAKIMQDNEDFMQGKKQPVQNVEQGQWQLSVGNWQFGLGNLFSNLNKDIKIEVSYVSREDSVIENSKERVENNQLSSAEVGLHALPYIDNNNVQRVQEVEPSINERCDALPYGANRADYGFDVENHYTLHALPINFVRADGPQAMRYDVNEPDSGIALSGEGLFVS